MLHLAYPNKLDRLNSPTLIGRFMQWRSTHVRLPHMAPSQPALRLFRWLLVPPHTTTLCTEYRYL